jgi:hypothetical protein
MPTSIDWLATLSFWTAAAQTVIEGDSLELGDPHDK